MTVSTTNALLLLAACLMSNATAIGLVAINPREPAPRGPRSTDPSEPLRRPHPA